MRPYYSTRSFGDTRVTIVDEGIGWYKAELIDGNLESVDAFGEDHPDGLPISFLVAHVRTPEASVLIDAGFDDPDSEWGRMFAKEWFVHRTAGLSAALSELGESRESITHIAITHGHFDHVAGLTVDTDEGPRPRFPNADVHVHEAEVAWLQSDAGKSESPDAARRIAVIEQAGLLHPVPNGFELAPGITMIYTGGESPGHCAVRVSEETSQQFFMLGDLFHYPFELEHLDWMAPWADREEMKRGRDRIFALVAAPDEASSSPLCVFSHNPFPGWGRVARMGERFAWHVSPDDNS